jgi:hypothetical protein
MNHAEFHKAVGAIAEGRYFSTSTEASTHTSGKTELTWRAYVEGPGWTQSHRAAEMVLDELKHPKFGTVASDPAALDPKPEASF